MQKREIHARLTARSDELTTDLARLTKPPEAGASIGFGKRVGDGTTEAVERIATTAAARSIARSLSEIEVALERLDAGTYGTCEQCGSAIAEARLEARPATVRCVDCAK